MIKLKFSECEYVEQFNYSGQKRNDWPAYRASHYKTINSFENDFVRYTVAGANEANLFMDICSPELANGVRLESAVSAFSDPDEIGQRVRDLHAFFLKVEGLALPA